MLTSNVVDRGFVKVNVLASNVVDRGFEALCVKPRTMKLLFVASTLSTQHSGVRAKTG